MDKKVTYMYLKAPRIRYIALVGLPVLLQLHAVNGGIVNGLRTIPSTIVIDFYLIIAIK